ncbi:hypothetical protein RB195_012154 [Necator americanus]|uniref:Uncharacterized protein n=1 Tax=Necator americanus TaxID=51031 RepID=A0ABR1D5R9_NECAM
MLNALEETADEMEYGVRYTDGPAPAESSAGYVSRTSSPSFTKHENILDDNGKEPKRVEEMLRPAHPRHVIY